MDKKESDLRNNIQDIIIDQVVLVTIASKIVRNLDTNLNSYLDILFMD